MSVRTTASHHITSGHKAQNQQDIKMQGTTMETQQKCFLMAVRESSSHLSTEKEKRCKVNRSIRLEKYKLHHVWQGFGSFLFLL